jgi:hypothetical protein
MAKELHQQQRRLECLAGVPGQKNGVLLMELRREAERSVVARQLKTLVRWKAHVLA